MQQTLDSTIKKCYNNTITIVINNYVRFIQHKTYTNTIIQGDII